MKYKLQNDVREINNNIDNLNQFKCSYTVHYKIIKSIERSS